MAHVFEPGRTVTRRELWQGSVGRFGEEHIALADGRRITLAVLQHPGASAVVPVHRDGRVVMLRQYRHAVRETLWEIPAGKLNAGEMPEACAQRELQEETGLCAGQLVPLGSIHVTPGYSDECIHLFLALDLRRGEAALDGDESIVCSELPFVEALRMAESGEISDAKSAVALLRARRHVSELVQGGLP